MTSRRKLPEGRALSRRQTLQMLGRVVAVAPLASLLGCKSGSDQPGGSGTDAGSGAGVSGGAGGSGAAAGSGGSGAAAGGGGAGGAGAEIAWASGGTAAMTALATFTARRSSRSGDEYLTAQLGVRHGAHPRDLHHAF